MRTFSQLALGASALLWGSTSLFSQTTLLGAGATFPAPLYERWATEYHQAHPGVKVVYQAVGSGAGIKKILEKSVDFGASDAPLTAQEKGPSQETILHLPVTMGAVAVAFHLPGVTHLKLNSEVLAGIFLGHIKQWNDARLQALNGGTPLPDLAITVAYRSDSSGTTAVFTDYLSQVSAEWKTKAGSGKSVKFPAGVPAKGNDGIAGLIKQKAGAVSYLDLSIAKKNHLGVALLQNQSGHYIPPSPESVSAAAGSKAIPEDLCLSITNGKGPQDYPIAALSYLLVYEKQKDPAQGQFLVNYLRWAVREGQKYAAELHYAPLPANLATRIEAKIGQIH